MLIYSEFLNMMTPKLSEIFENKDLVLKNEFQRLSPEEFTSEFEKFDAQEQALTVSLFKHFMMDLGINSANQLEFLKTIDIEPGFQAQYSKLVVKAYSEKIVPANCNNHNVRRLKKIIDSSMGFGKANMFKTVKDPEKKERLLRNYFEYKSFVEEGILFSSCYHLMNLRTHNLNVEKLKFAEMQLDQKFSEFMMSDAERHEHRKKLGKHYDSYHNKIRVEEQSTLAES